ncbi:acetylcholinesterase-like, partial [Varanus komodoensis]|uniref:acetylcholinesterase-like n=1 Tax=Varanus komodoensis TaxID=61221 RepID=UPI001CF77B76
PFVPTTDGDFLPDDPEELLQDGHFQVKPILIGVTSDEGSTFVPYLFPGINDGLITWEQLLRGASRTLRKATEETVQAVALKYSVECHGPARHRWAMSRLCGDYFSVCPATESAGKFTQRGSPVYLYSFRHHSSGSVWPRWIGAPHGAELPYVFGTLESVLDVNQTYTQAEAALSSRVMQYWAEFSRSGNPTGSTASTVQWSRCTATQQNFFQLSTEPPQIMKVSPARHCGFLDSFSSKTANPRESGYFSGQESAFE